MYYRHRDGRLIGFSGFVVDDALQYGTEELWKATKVTMDLFTRTDHIEECINFSRIHVGVNKGSGGSFVLSQSEYAEKIVLMSADAAIPAVQKRVRKARMAVKYSPGNKLRSHEAVKNEGEGPQRG